MLTIRVPRAVLLLNAAALISLIGCSGKAPKYSASGKMPVGGGSAWKVSVQERSPAATAKPWEHWSLSRTLQGHPIRDGSFLQGDELLKSGQYQKALEVYEKIDSKRFSPDEAETLTARLASVQLSLDKARESLATLSDFFKRTKRAEDDVSARFSLLFGYAYGRLADFNQSLAWFSRAHRLTTRAALPPGALTTEAALGEAAEAGARMLIRSIPQDNLQSVAEHWTADMFIGELIGEEQSLRAKSGYAPRSLDLKRPYWEGDLNDGAAAPQVGTLGAVQASSDLIGVILPLTGSFASLGTATKNGIELAIEKSGLGARASFLDDMGDGLQASVRAREFISGERGTIILGPILAAAADRVSEVARETATPVLTLSKAAGFQTGDDIFRLGPTSASQVRSLLEVCQKQFNLGMYAVVYPDDAVGQDFAYEFKNALKDFGALLAGEYQYTKSDLQAFSRIASELEQSAAQAVFLPDNLTAAGRFFSALSPEFRQSIKAIGPATWYNPIELQQSRMALEGLMFVSPFLAESSHPAVVNFIADYEARYQNKPDFMAAQGFDAATIVLEAIRRSQSHSMTLSDALRSIQLYEGLTGEITVQAHGELARKFRVVSFEGGQLLQVGASHD